MKKRKPLKRKLTERTLRAAKAQSRAYLIWDEVTRGLAVAIYPTGRKSWIFVYSRHNRSRWYTIGDADALPLSNARQEARSLRVLVDRGADPQAEKRAERGKGAFEELAARYRKEWAMKNNRSWKQADRLITRYALAKLGKLPITGINRADIETVIRAIDKPILANQVLVSISAVFSWLIRKEIVRNNPCQAIERNPVKSRERILSDEEIPVFWAEFDKAGRAGIALKIGLLLGARPGEIAKMQQQDVGPDHWWVQPGLPQGDWPGTKNSQTHAVWLSDKLRIIVDEHLSGPRLKVDGVMRKISAKLGVDRATAHDLRRTFSSTVTKLGYGREAMNRLTNHKEGGIADVYDRAEYGPVNRKIWEAVGDHIMTLVEGRRADEKMCCVPQIAVMAYNLTRAGID